MTLPVVLFILFAVSASVYLLMIKHLPYQGDFLLKSLPIFCLALLVFLFVPGPVGILLMVGLLFSAGGDISLSYEGETFFLIGLGLFLIAHVFYIIAFAQGATMMTGRLPWIILWFVFAMGMLTILFPHLAQMKVPVTLYITLFLLCW